MITETKDPIMEAKQRLYSKLETLPGWEMIKPVDYGHVGQSQPEADIELYRTVKEVWEKNWDATDSRYYHLEATQDLLLRRWGEYDTLAHLFHYGPKNSGKNQALDIHRKFAPNPIFVTGPSINSIYQVIDMIHPTLLIDECDRLGTVKEASDYVQAMLAILNVYSRGELTMRGGKDGIPQLFDLFCPKLLAGTVLLPGTLPDRCIRVDCERNAKDVPLDLAIPDTLKGQLVKYSSQHADYNGLSKEQFKMLLGDNRATQLWFPYYQVCPDPDGQKAILELAVEHINENREIESYGETAQVLEEIVTMITETMENATVATVLSNPPSEGPYKLDLSRLVIRCESFIPKKVKDPNKWLGWQLKTLQFPRERVGHTNERIVRVPVHVLAKKIRRYAPSLLGDGKKR
jgi:hypothetical protein